MTYDSAINAICKALYVATSVTFLYTAGYGSLSALPQRAILLLLTAPTIFLAGKKLILSNVALTRAINVLCALIMVACNIYLLSVWQDRMLRTSVPPVADTLMGVALIVTVLIATWRSAGPSLPIIAVAFILYGMYGSYFPDVVAHRGVSWQRIVNFLYITTEGIYGTPIGIAATYIVVFILFGAFLNAFGGGECFVDIAYAATGRYRGGPAKTAILASGLMGMISGSPSANVATTGTFTIPLMKKVGYQPHVAGAIEAVASTAGLFTPPIMGAGAFIMADYLQIPYTAVCKAAIVPCILYFLALLLAADAQAVKNGLKGMPPSELPRIGDVMRKRALLLIPIVVLVALIVVGYSPMKSAFFATVLTVVVAFFSRFTRPTPSKLYEALVDGARQSVGIVMVCAAAGIIVGVISLTGLGAKISYTLIATSGGNMYVAAFMSMVATLVLGCAIPPIAVYIVAAATLAAPLAQLGASPICAHMFLFIYAALGSITPPVALAAFIGSAIAGAPATKTGITAFRFGLPGFIMPFLFITSPSVILIGETGEILLNVFTATLAVFCFVATFEGFLFFRWNVVSRVLLGIGSLMLFWPGIRTDLVGFGCIALAVLATRTWAARRSAPPGPVVKTEN